MTELEAEEAGGRQGVEKLEKDKEGVAGVARSC